MRKLKPLTLAEKEDAIARMLADAGVSHAPKPPVDDWSHLKEDEATRLAEIALQEKRSRLFWEDPIWGKYMSMFDRSSGS